MMHAGIELPPDGFDAVSVQNVGSTYIIVSWDLPTHSNGTLINFGPPVTPSGTALQLERGVGRHQCCSQPAQHEKDSPPGRPPDPESDTNELSSAYLLVRSLTLTSPLAPRPYGGAYSQSPIPQLEQDVGMGHLPPSHKLEILDPSLKLSVLSCQDLLNRMPLQ
eukprot:Em0006g975a